MPMLKKEESKLIELRVTRAIQKAFESAGPAPASLMTLLQTCLASSDDQFLKDLIVRLDLVAQNKSWDFF